MEVLPRLRISRQPQLSSSPPRSRDSLSATDALDEDDDNESTPRLSIRDIAVEDMSHVNGSANAIPAVEETPAAKLRSLITRFPRSSSPMARTPLANPSSQMLRDSDVESLDLSTRGRPDSPSMARTNLKDIFSRALTEKGDSPSKTRRRSNSFGAHSHDLTADKKTPRPKRASLSDDEFDKATKQDLGATPRVPVRKPLMFDDLRDRLDNMSVSSTPQQSEYSFRGNLNDISLPDHTISPPVATSTPLRQSTSHIPLQFSASNLMNDDSDMQRALKALDSSASNGASGDPESDTSLPKDNPREVHGELQNNEISPRHRSESHQSIDLSKSSDNERIIPSQLARYIGKHTSPNGLRHRESRDSLSTSGSSYGNKSPAVSIARASTRRSPESHPHRNPPSQLNAEQSQSSARMLLKTRSRTLSQPTKPSVNGDVPATTASPIPRPASSLSHTAGHSRTKSQPLGFHYSSSSSRASSPASSISSVDRSQRGKDNELLHERERNWNSPHPKWNANTPDPRRSPALPPSRTTSPSPQLARVNVNRSPLPVRENSDSHSPEKTASGMASQSRNSIEQWQHRVRLVPRKSNADLSTGNSPALSIAKRVSPSLRNVPPSKHNRQTGSPSPVPSSDYQEKKEELTSSSETDEKDLPNSKLYNGQPPEPTFGDTSSNAGEKASEYKDSVVANRTRLITSRTSSFSSRRHFSPPPTPPALPSDSVMLTPSRLSNVNGSKYGPKTPSPPRGLPDLPEPPSSEEDFDSDRTPPVRAPANPASRARIMDPKTPRPPGAWATPYSTAKIKILPPNVDEESHVVNELHTPPPSFSRATTLALQTPAPPGAWLPTPHNKKLSQKVRFNEKEDTRSTDLSSLNPAGSDREDTTPEDGEQKREDFSPDKRAMDVEMNVPRVSHRSAVIRQLDAFGKEIATSEDRMEETLRNAADSHRPTGDQSGSRKTRLRLVDSMGREIKDRDSSVDEDGPSSTSNGGDFIQGLQMMTLERKKAQDLMQKTIDGLKDDLARFDITPKGSNAIDARIADLDDQSRRAREEREKLLRRMHGTVQSDEVRSAPQPAKINVFPKKSYSLTKYGWLFLVLQVLIIIGFYWISYLDARQLFLSNYLDPLYPELYLHVTNPEIFLLPSADSASSDISHRTSKWGRGIETLLSLLGGIVNVFTTSIRGSWTTSSSTPQTAKFWPT